MNLDWPATLPYFLPLLAAFLYASAALFFKAATTAGAGVLTVTVVANIVTAAGFLFFLGGDGPPLSWGMAGASSLVGLLFVLGQVSVVFALRQGDVSVATPLMNAKVVFVPLLLFCFIGEPLTAGVATALLFTVLGVVLVQGGKPEQRKALGMTVVCALLAALFFALFDVVVQTWSPVYGFGKLVPPGMVVAAVLSLLMLPLGPGLPRSRRGFTSLALGSVLMAAQAAALVATIGYFQEATAANILYASRALWSLVVVWLFGRTVGNFELQLGRRELATRITGASFLVAAVVVVVL